MHRSLWTLALAAAGYVVLSGCIIVKETQVPYEEDGSKLSRRVERLERQVASHQRGLPSDQTAVPRLGEVGAISSPGNLLILRLEPGHGLSAGSRIALVGPQGFKTLAEIEEVFDPSSASARRIGEPTLGTEASIGDHVVPIG